MAYGLEKLLSVRVLRENKARKRLARVKTELEGARKQREHKQKELADYRRWRIEEEERLFGGLKSKQASPRDLLLFNDTADTLRQNQAAKMRQLQEAGQAVAKAEENLVEARQHYIAVNRKKVKLEEYQSIWAEARRRLAEQYEEKEMDVPGKPVRCPVV